MKVTSVRVNNEYKISKQLNYDLERYVEIIYTYMYERR